AATVLGLDPQAVQRQIESAQTDRGAPTRGDTAVGDGGKLHAAEPRKGGGSSSRSAPPPAPTAAPTAGGSDASHVVFALRRGKITAVTIHSGLTDQDYIEVTSGLTEQYTVVVLSSSPTR